jgi:zinc protease
MIPLASLILMSLSSAPDPAPTSAAPAAPTSAPATPSVEIVRVARPGVPVVHLRVLVLSGSADDPPGKEGLAAFTGALLRRGTRSHSREALDEALDRIAATISVQVQKEFTVLSGLTLRRNLEEFLPLFASVLLEPRLDPAELEKLKVDQIDAVEAVRQSDEALSREVFQQELYAGHPYGHLDAGSLSSIRSFTLEDVRGFYDAHYRRGNVIGGLAGAVDDALESRLRADLERLPEGEVRRPARPAPRLSGRRAVLVEQEGRTQTHMRVGHPIAVNRAHPDYAALRVANAYLGQHRQTTGRLFQAVREKRGLAYGAYSYVEHFVGAGGPIKVSAPNLARRQQAFHFWTYPRAENAAFVLKLGIAELEDLARVGVPEEELAPVRDSVRNAFPFEIETAARELSLELDDRIYGIRGFAARFPAEVAALTPDKVREAARRHFRPADLLIVMVCPDAEALRRQLLSGDAPLIYPSGVDAAPLAADDARVRSLDLKLKPESIKILKAAELFR